MDTIIRYSIDVHGFAVEGTFFIILLSYVVPTPAIINQARIVKWTKQPMKLSIIIPFQIKQ